MYPLLTAIWICVVLTMPAYAGEPVGDMSQLMQLNRASEQELNNIQRPPGYPGTAQSTEQQMLRQNLDRQQQADLQLLQERQRRELLLLNHRARSMAAPGWQPRLDIINRQRQFQLQQQNQLNRFRGQQPPWVR